MSEQREFTRVPFPFRARLEAGGVTVAGAGVDVSACGFRLRCEQEVAVGLEGRLTIDLAPDVVIAMRVRVARSGAGELALAVVAIGPDAFEALRNLVRFNAPDPERVEEEFDAHLGLLRRDG